MVLFTKPICKLSIRVPIKICTDTPIAIPIAINKVCPLLELKNVKIF